MRLVSRLADRLTTALMVIGALFAFSIALLVLTDIIARNTGIVFYGAPEYARNMIVAIVFLQLPFCVRIDSMLRMDFLVSAAPRRLRTGLLVFGCVLGLVFFAAIAYGAFEPTVNAWRTGEVEDRGLGVRVPTWPTRLAILLGCAGAAMLYVLRGLELILQPGAGPGSAEAN